MINFKDFYTYEFTTPIENSIPEVIGTTTIRYEIKRYRDVRNLANPLAYQVRCTQRVVIPNATAYEIGPNSGTSSSFEDYPALLSNNIVIQAVSEGSPIQPNIQLVSYSPRTLNSSISSSTSSSSSDPVVRQHTSGSAISQANSFSTFITTSVNESTLGSVASDVSSLERFTGVSNAYVGNTKGVSNQSSGSNSMTVKDWGCYTSLDSTATIPTWVWGQEYPWDLVQFNQVNPSIPTEIKIPNFVQNLLYDSVSELLLPPSQLSLFGIDVVMQAVWLIEPDVGDTTMQFSHEIKCSTATHQVEDSVLSAVIAAPSTSEIVSPVSLDLCVYGLDPVSYSGVSIGFVPNKFLIKPSPYMLPGAPVQFKTVDQDNSLMLVDTTDYSAYPLMPPIDDGAGFGASQTALSANLTYNCQSLSITGSFKIADVDSDYTLHMKHWKTGDPGFVLTITFNGDTTNSLTKYVDALEGEGGEANMLSIQLRNNNYGSVNYHDYLQLGLNTVEITITPISPVSSGVKYGYQIRSISIERN